MTFACITVDLDGSNCYRTIHGLDERSFDVDPMYAIGIPRMLKFFEDAAIPSTLFVIGSDVEVSAHAEILRGAHESGHELGNHTFHHRYDLRSLNLDLIEADIAAGEDAIESVSGRRPSGFRVPGYNIDSAVLSICEDRGYTYDSSLFPCPSYYLAKAGIMTTRRLTGRPSRSSMTLPQTLTAPIAPYRPDVDAPWNRGSAALIEIPMCLTPTLRFPVIGTSLHLLGKTGFDAALGGLQKTYDTILNLEFHAIDFMDADDTGVGDLVGLQPDLKVPWHQKRELYSYVFGRLRERYVFSTMRDATQAVESEL